MSWSVSAIGKADAVTKKVRESLEKSAQYMQQPEPAVVRAVADLVTAACSAFPPNWAVRVNGNGYQSGVNDGKGEKIGAINSVNLTIEPISELVMGGDAPA